MNLMAFEVLISQTMETLKQQQLANLLRIQQTNELSSSEEPDIQEPISRSQYRKPIKNAFSDNESQSDSDIEPSKIGTTPLPPKPAQSKSILQQAQGEIRWTREDTTEIDLLSKLEGNGMKDKKIRELAAKIRNLNIAYEKQKTIRKNFEVQLNSTLKANQEAKKTQDERQSLEKTINSSRVAKEKCPNCPEQDKKIMEMRLKIQNMKTEVNKAHRLISRELGQNFDIDHALSQQNTWKGRQQKIQKLKYRVKQLEDKLASNGVNVSHMSGFSQMPTPQTKSNSFSATQRTSTLADNKRKELENLKVQVEALRTENELLQGKVKSLNSRKIILESELKDLKADFEKKRLIFIEKSENDDRFIALLKQENDKLKKDEKVVTKVVYKETKENTEQVNTLKKENEVLKRKVKQLLRQKQQLQTQQYMSKEQKVTKISNERVRDLSAEKKRQLEEEYVNGNKYLKKLSVQDQQEIYKTWKESKQKF